MKKRIPNRAALQATLHEALKAEGPRNKLEIWIYRGMKSTGDDKHVSKCKRAFLSHLFTK